MKSIYSSILFRLMALMAAAAMASSCADDLLEAGPGGVMDGSLRHIAVKVAFESETEQPLESRAADTAQPGNSIQDIDNLRLLIYDKEGLLLEDFTLVSGKKAVGVDLYGTSGNNISITKIIYSPAEDNRLPDEKDDGYQDSATGKVTFNITLPATEFYIYAVANAPDLTRDQLADRQAMKNTPRRWVVGDLSQNSEMFGIFSHGPNREATDDNPLRITNETTSLHCWLRRLASKVTVAFDGTELYDGVEVYIDSICLFDIPQQCLLGNPNTAGRVYGSTYANTMTPTANRYDKGTNGLIYYGPYQKIQDLPKGSGDKILSPETFMHVCNSAHPYFGKGKEGKDSTEIIKRHGHAEASLFFYENLQGTGNSKKQDANGDNKIDNPHPEIGNPDSGWKDGKPFGTYVQVHGHYRCSGLADTDGLGTNSGPIRYRFMLGKNVEDDFNAERNTHYKLTLKFKGYGNDADWHIEYEQKKGIVVASPQYVSYLYNKKMMATVKVTGPIPDGSFLKAEIVDERGCWKPWGDTSTTFPVPDPSFITSVTTNEDIDGRQVGFLSLRQTKVIKIEDPDMVGAPSNKYNGREPKNCALLKNYYAGAGYTHGNLGERCYKIIPNTSGHGSNETGSDGKYFVSATQKQGDEITERVFSIPLYTRAKELLTWSGFTGNNPYESYARKQRIKISVVESDEKTPVPGFKEVYLDVIQVRRITNPKGVWRRKGNASNFHAKLTHIDPDDHTKFRVFNSAGKWSAEVISTGAPVISLTSTYEGSGSGNKPQTNVNRIEGENGHPVDFYINFNGGVGCAVVKVRYNNFTCEHDIFCRSGYEEPIDVAGNGQRWSSFNIDHFEGDSAVHTKSPLQEGSLFRRGCRIAIRPSNNERFKLGVAPGSKTFTVRKPDASTDEELSWSKIVNTEASLLYDWTISNKGEHIATAEDFYTLTASSANDINFQINKGYGVLYGDGATETQLDTANAYGYNDETGGDSPKGMRGVFVCNSATYNHIFLPIGYSGHGHRKSDPGWRNTDQPGTMRYAGRSALVDPVADKSMMEYRPLFYDLAIRPGAIYWTKVLHLPQPYAQGKDWVDSHKSSAFDFNYFTMGFEGYNNDAVGDSKTDGDVRAKSHACFIRTVFGEAK